VNTPKEKLLIPILKERTTSVTNAQTSRYRELAAFLLTVLLAIITLVSCGAPETNTASNGTSSPPTTTGKQVKVVGSTSLLPLVAKAADLFQQSHPDVQVTVTGGGSVAGLNAVMNRKADIGTSDIYADPSVYPDPNLTDHIICGVSFALIADPQINITSLSTQQIIGIFSNKIVNWKEVGGPDLPITTVIRPSTSGTRALFRKYILGGLEEAGKPLTSDSASAILDTVAHTPGAIGYLTTTMVNSTVRTVDIDGVSPTIQNIQSGKYKFWGYGHMYTLQNGINSTTAFLDFMRTPQVKQLIQQSGFIPVDAVKSLSPTGSTNG
jgi:phosphate transport system substrate-binding protein